MAWTREDLARQWAFNNDVEVDLAGGGDPPIPQSLECLQAEFDSEAANHAANERAYRACGFVEEGRLRDHVWHDGSYRDLIYMGLLRREWQTPDAQPSH